MRWQHRTIPYSIFHVHEKSLNIAPETMHLPAFTRMFPLFKGYDDKSSHSTGNSIQTNNDQKSTVILIAVLRCIHEEAFRFIGHFDGRVSKISFILLLHFMNVISSRKTFDEKKRLWLDIDKMEMNILLNGQWNMQKKNPLEHV